MCVCVRACVRACVHEREREGGGRGERERGREGERERERGREGERVRGSEFPTVCRKNKTVFRQMNQYPVCSFISCHVYLCQYWLSVCRVVPPYLIGWQTAVVIRFYSGLQYSS